jgi:hypothetical protein
LIDINLVFSILTLGFGLGLLHALDADHIMAISSLASSDKNDQDSKHQKTGSIGRMAGFCARWAIGHAAVLLGLAALFIFAKFELPSIVPLLAEKLIGILLIGLGCWILWTLRQHHTYPSGATGATTQEPSTRTGRHCSWAGRQRTCTSYHSSIRNQQRLVWTGLRRFIFSRRINHHARVWLLPW